MLISVANSAAKPTPTAHHHHGTQSRSRYRTVCDITRELDTRPRVVFPIMPASLAVVRLDRDLPMPSRAHDGDAGIDLFSSEDVELGPGQRSLVATGIAVAIPHGMVGLIHRAPVWLHALDFRSSIARAPSMPAIAVKSRWP